MKNSIKKIRTAALVGVFLALFGVFAYAALRSGPLAPIQITTSVVEDHAISPALFGIGTVEARYTYRIGPTAAGRIKSVNVHVGDKVKAGDLLGEMDPVDLDERIVSQRAAIEKATANISVVRAQVLDITATMEYAKKQAKRYELALREHITTEETSDAKQQEFQVAEARLSSAKAGIEAAVLEQKRLRADLEGLNSQRNNLLLVAPVDGLVATRQANPGTTLVAGQPVVELIDPSSAWINVRFDQLQAAGLRSNLPAHIVLRSMSDVVLEGNVLRVEPMADAVTEEILAKVSFNQLPESGPLMGELAEVTVELPPLPALPVVFNPSIQQVHGNVGVWVVENEGLRFSPIVMGKADLEGRTQIIKGANPGDHVVVYSQRAIDEHSRIKIVEKLTGGFP
jgi:HlyD family secretion protein